MAYSAKQRKVGASIEGAKQLAKDLQKMGEEATGVLSQAAQAGGQIALNDAREHCPVRTGALKNSLNMKINKVTPTKADVVVDYDRTLHYGTFIELGVRGRAANPFLRNAVDNNIRQINEAIVDAVAKGVKL